MNAARIHSFLLKNPRPASVRFTRADADEPETIVLRGRSYQRTAETIAVLVPDLMECLDAEGKLLRAMRGDSPEAQRSDAALIPTGLAGDPSALMLTHFANLLHRAYEHSTEIAFSKMVELVERIGDRAESIEARLERTEAANRRLSNEQAEDAIERAEEAAAEAAQKADGGDLLQNLAGAFMSGKMQGATKPATNGANGKAAPAKGQGS